VELGELLQLLHTLSTPRQISALQNIIASCRRNAQHMAELTREPDQLGRSGHIRFQNAGIRFGCNDDVRVQKQSQAGPILATANRIHEIMVRHRDRHHDSVVTASRSAREVVAALQGILAHSHRLPNGFTGDVEDLRRTDGHVVHGQGRSTRRHRQAPLDIRERLPAPALVHRRSDPAGRDEQLERFYLLAVDANPFNPALECFDSAHRRRRSH
jgi:hypothetical protein